MSEEFRAQLTDVHTMLAEATRLNDSGQHGAALKQACHASEYLAAAYLFATKGQSLPPNDATFELFYETVQEAERHPGLLSRIEDVVGDVYVLREAYEPAMLDETTAIDAQQMIDRMTALLMLAEKLF